MKKLEIKTEKATLLVVDLPECKTHLIYKGYYVMDSSDKGLNDKCRKISQGDTQGFYYIGTDCKYLGKVSEITEEEWKGVVPNVETTINKFNCYPNYYIDGYLNTAKESGYTLLKCYGVFSDDFYTHFFSTDINSSEDRYKSQRRLEEYFELKEKVWSNPHVFIKTL